jgi:hypothetical protein
MDLYVTFYLHYMEGGHSCDVGLDTTTPARSMPSGRCGKTLGTSDYLPSGSCTQDDLAGASPGLSQRWTVSSVIDTGVMT